MRITGTTPAVPAPSFESKDLKQAAHKEQTEPKQPVEPQPEQQLDPEQLDRDIARMNQAAKALNSSIHFEIVNKNRIAIQIVNDETGEVIRHIPAKALVDALKSMERTMGVLLDQKV